MKPRIKRALPWLLTTLLMFASAVAARADVRDNAKIFSQEAVDRANTRLDDMKTKDKKELIIETFPSIPQDQADNFKSLSKDKFYEQWVAARAKDLGVNGIYVLVCMDPKHLEVHAGKYTQRFFTDDDAKKVRDVLVRDLKAGDNDSALSDTVSTVDQTLTEAEQRGAGHGNPRSSTNYGGAAMPPSSPGNGGYTPRGNSFPTGMPGGGGSGLGLGSLVCLGVGIVIVISLISSIFRRQSSFGGYSQANYPPQPPAPGPSYGGYGGGGGWFGGGGAPSSGGGFGRGLLGGLLGGALGGYAENRFEHRNDDSGNQQQNQTGWTPQDSGSNFDPGPSDAGQGFDSGGAGGDFGGGGGSSGGDFGGGGGGDSGSSAGRDF